MGIGETKTMILAILGLGLILRLVSLNQSLWLDEGINVMAAKSYSLFNMVTQYAVADFHPPGWFVILWSWGKLFGYSEFTVRLPSVFFGVLTIYIIYLIGKKLVSENLGLISALLLSINPLHIYYSQEARMYVLATLAVAINIFLLIKLIKGEKVNLILLIISNLFILLSDYIAYFIFPAQLIFLLLIKRREIMKQWFMALIGALVFFTVWIPVFLKQLDIGASASANLPTWKFVVGGFDFKTIPLTIVKFIIGRISLANKIIYAVAMLPVVSLFIYLLWRGWKTLTGYPKKMLFAWVLIPPLIATIISVIIPVYSYFRVLYIIPGFIILIANGILSFNRKIRYGFLTTVILIEAFCTLVYLLNPAYQREDWRGLVKFFEDVRPGIILFESSGTFPTFDYYNKDNLYAKGALKDFPAKDETAVAGLGDLLKGQSELYLVDYLVQISDPSRLVARKLKELGYEEVGITDFHGVGFVYHYVNKI